MHISISSNDVVMNDVHSFDDVIMHYDSSCNSTKLKELSNILNEFIRNSPPFCPLVILSAFNVDMLQKKMNHVKVMNQNTSKIL